MLSQLSRFPLRALENPEQIPSPSPTVLRVLIVMLVAIGVLARLSPLSDWEGRLFWQYMTEDGYLMQTVARNMAIGLGMSTAEGTLPTNGVQPLATFLFAALHFVANGSKTGGIALVTAFSALVSVLAAFLLFKVGSRIWSSLPHGRELAAVAAALWFAAPQITEHSMNGLETGVYYVVLLTAVIYYLRAASSPHRMLRWSQRVILGLLLGLAFLARNDAAFLIGALLAAHLLLGGSSANGGYRTRLLDCIACGVISIGVSVPWLINNYLLFGSIVPISGTAQSYKASFAQNIAYIPANMFEVSLLYAPVPRAMETMPAVMLVTLAIVATLIWAIASCASRLALATQRFYLTGVLLLFSIGVYYGFFFGAPHFIPRYMSPASIFMWTGAVMVGYLVAASIGATRSALPRLLPAITGLLMIAAASFAWKDHATGGDHMHKQVVDWVSANVSDREWIGAVQTGTLGFFHDRTINLDGKVNPDALRAKLREGHVINYVLASRINYIVDWVGVAGWVEDGKYPSFSEQFAVAVKDRKRNLAVLNRRLPVAQ